MKMPILGVIVPINPMELITHPYLNKDLLLLVTFFSIHNQVFYDSKVFDYHDIELHFKMLTLTIVSNFKM